MEWQHAKDFHFTILVWIYCQSWFLCTLYHRIICSHAGYICAWMYVFRCVCIFFRNKIIIIIFAWFVCSLDVYGERVLVRMCVCRGNKSTLKSSEHKFISCVKIHNYIRCWWRGCCLIMIIPLFSTTIPHFFALISTVHSRLFNRKHLWAQQCTHSCAKTRKYLLYF